MHSKISECPRDVASWYCLNGATCFSVKIQESVLYNCWCRSGFHGARCDYKYALARRREQEAASNGTNRSRPVQAERDTANDLDPPPGLAPELGFVVAPGPQDECKSVAQMSSKKLRLIRVDN